MVHNVARERITNPTRIDMVAMVTRRIEDSEVVEKQKGEMGDFGYLLDCFLRSR